MRPQKSQKIDLTKDYPCPCRRRGRLLPIMLTDAFGCDRCQKIFVVDEKNQIIEQLSSNYPGKQAWRWTGYRWITAHYGVANLGLPWMLVLFLIPILLTITLASRLGLLANDMIWAAIAMISVASIVIVLLFSFINRH